MGCGHSKISIIYSRKSKSKRSSKKSEAPDKSDSEEEDGTEKEKENCSNQEADDQESKIQVKSLGGALLAQIDISNSQQDFFKMLDEKIQNGPDYNSESESEILAEHQRITTLLKDWESASAGSRTSLDNAVPSSKSKNKNKTNYQNSVGSPNKGYHEIINNNSVASVQRSSDIIGRNYNNSTSSVVQVSQSIIHQNYGVSLLQDPRHQQYNPQQYFHPAPPPQAPYQPPQSYNQQPPFVQYRQVYNDLPHPTQYQGMSPMYGPVSHPPNSSQGLGFINQYSMKPSPGLAARNQPSFRGSNQDDLRSSPSFRTVVTPKHVPDFSNGVLVEPRFSSQNVQVRGAREPLQSHYQNLSSDHETYVETQHYPPSVTYETVPILIKANNTVTYVPRK